jgi:exosome complex RNA-binding protein Rrp42 (RNase PH superfamily)
MACVTGEVVRPFPDRPTEGIITFSVELSALASPQFEGGRYGLRGGDECEEVEIPLVELLSRFN